MCNNRLHGLDIEEQEKYTAQKSDVQNNAEFEGQEIFLGEDIFFTNTNVPACTQPCASVKYSHQTINYHAL